MQTSNYLPYTVSYDFKLVRRRRGGYSRYARFMQRYAHKRVRQAVREFLHQGRERELSRYKLGVTGWDID